MCATRHSRAALRLHILIYLLSHISMMPKCPLLANYGKGSRRDMLGLAEQQCRQIPWARDRVIPGLKPQLKSQTH